MKTYRYASGFYEVSGVDEDREGRDDQGERLDRWMDNFTEDGARLKLALPVDGGFVFIFEQEYEVRDED